MVPKGSMGKCFTMELLQLINKNIQIQIRK